MSGPATDPDAPPFDDAADCGGPPTLERHRSRATDVGGTVVRRALPSRRRRTVGAWCFVDHFGELEPGEGGLMQVGPHPHIGLHTVTWLVAGEVLHRDSLGSEQLIRPGQLNLMTAGRGVAHAEESPTGRRGDLRGAQLWVAQPDGTRGGPAAFEHHAELPLVGLGGPLSATLLVGTLAGATSPARSDSPLVGAAVHTAAAGAARVALEPSFEHAVVVLEGVLEVADEAVAPGELLYLGTGREDVDLAAHGPTEALLLGGEPFGDPPLMWWNFVARTRDEIDEARADWEAGSERFGDVASDLDRIPAPEVLWRR